ncbi:DMT family protein [bacterium]|nr:DMT family protein [bacterium]
MEKIYPILLLAAANIFMCFAWYWHLKIEDKPIFLIILLSWGIAFFEYSIQVPANRLGYKFYTVGQLKVMQEVITMIVFAFFSVFYMKEKLTLDFLFAGLCLVGAVFFMFRHAF